MLIALAGATCGGKSSVAEQLRTCFPERKVVIVNQDDYYKPNECLAPIPHLDYWNFDEPTAVDFERLIADCESALASGDGEEPLVIVDGNMLLEWPALADRFQLCFFFVIDYDTCRSRRLTRAYEPPDVPGYFDEFAWPNYKRHLAQLEQQQTYTNSAAHFIDSSWSTKLITSKIEIHTRQKLHRDWVKLMTEPLDVTAAQEFVTGPENGATSVFIGTTRNNFQGKQVLRLEYEAYESMAAQQLTKLCTTTHAKYPTIDRIAVFHRLGVVPVCEASVIIAISSPHRSDAQLGTQFAIDRLKQSVPIWKKEVYGDGSSNWKENCECTWGTSKKTDNTK